MSELKEHLFCDCNEMFLENGSPLSNDIRPYYLKSEADKVITGLKEEIHDLKRSLIVARHEVTKARGKKSPNKRKAKIEGYEHV